MTRRRAPADAPEGAIVVDKPAGITSHDVVAVARRVCGQPRIGHTGTLDPLATGVLPLLLGRATRLAQFLSSADKTYDATVRFGQATSSYDATGEPVGPACDVVVDASSLEDLLAGFRGAIQQSPPAVSAKRIAGRRAYALARSDKALTLPPVAVTVSELTLLRVDGPMAWLRVTCSAGFYVRSLAHDLGAALGAGGHLTALRRTRSGRFALEDAVGLESLTGGIASVAERVIPMAALLPDWPALIVTEEGRRRLGRGQPLAPTALIALAEAAGSGKVRVLDDTGHLLALADWRAGALHPFLVLV
jgi:tRNA pseudouridine55 synthase